MLPQANRVIFSIIKCQEYLCLEIFHRPLSSSTRSHGHQRAARSTIVPWAHERGRTNGISIEISLPWVPEATRLLNPAGQRPAKRAWGPKWAKRAKGRTRVASGGEPQRSRYVRYRFCTWSLIGYLKTCFFQRPQLVKTGHVKWTGFFIKTEWYLVEKKCVQQRDFIEGENLYSISFKIWENYNT